MDIGIVQNLARALAVFRESHDEITATQIIVLLTVAAKPGLSIGDIEEKVGLTRSAASRNVGKLSQYGYDGRDDGINLVVSEENPENRRQRLIYPTPAGLRVVEKAIKKITD